MALTEEDKKQLFGEIENQGFGYWVQNYGYDERFLKNRDLKLKELCDKARESMDNLNEYLREQGVEIC